VRSLVGKLRVDRCQPPCLSSPFHSPELGVKLGRSEGATIMTALCELACVCLQLQLVLPEYCFTTKSRFFMLLACYRRVHAIYFFDSTCFRGIYPKLQITSSASCIMGALKNYQNTQIHHFRNSKALSIVMYVFRCCTPEVVLFRNVSAMLYSLFCDSSLLKQFQSILYQHIVS
jgi:hypothetical protein